MNTASVPPKGNRTALMVLGVILSVLLLMVTGLYLMFRVVAQKLHAPQASGQAVGGASSSAGSEGSASAAGDAIGAVLGTDARGKSEIRNAVESVVQAGARIEQHDRSTGNRNGAPDADDSAQAVAAAGGLLGALGHSLGGAHRHDPVDFHVLEAMLPTALPGMERGIPRGDANDTMGIKATSADVEFRGPHAALVTVSIKDAAAFSGLAGLAEMTRSEQSQQGDSFEKDESIRGHDIHEQWDAGSMHGALSLIVAKRYGVDVHGDNVSMALLKNALEQVDIAKLESMRDANPAAP